MPSKPSYRSDKFRDGESAVRDYYDDNTNLFLKLGKTASTATIHQAVYLSKGDSLQDALNGQHRLISAQIDNKGLRSQGHILDLGCGVGASMLYLSKKYPDLSFTGITISETQYSKGTQLLQKHGGVNCSIVCASFQELPHTIPQVDQAYAIESFIHSPDADIFFAQVSSKLRSGGSIILFDDFRDSEPSTEGDRKVNEDFIAGWRALSLYSTTDVERIAQKHGLSLVKGVDLTDNLHLGRPRDKFIQYTLPLLRLLPLSAEYKLFLRGGNARQLAFARNLLRYKMLIFQKS